PRDLETFLRVIFRENSLMRHRDLKYSRGPSTRPLLLRSVGQRSGCRDLLRGKTSMRVLVTGGAGFVGSHLCDALLAEGNHVVCVDNLLTGSLRNIEHLKNESR